MLVSSSNRVSDTVPCLQTYVAFFSKILLDLLACLHEKSNYIRLLVKIAPCVNRFEEFLTELLLKNEYSVLTKLLQLSKFL